MTAPQRLQQPLRESKSRAPRPDFLFIRTNNIINKVKLSDIKWIHADGNYCYIHAGNRRYAVKISLKKITEKLTSGRFIRIHKSHVVQVDYIDRIDTNKNLILVGNQQLPVGRVFKIDLMQKLNII